MNFDKGKAKRILLDLHGLLDCANIEHALICGTALGAYRNSDFLSEDIDILCNAEDYWKVRDLFDGPMDFEYNCIWRREIALYKYGRKIDILFADIEKENTYIYIYKPNSITGKYHTEQRYVWKTEHMFPYANIEFLGQTFNIPANCPAFFEDYYGLNWKTPIQDWNRDKYPPPNLDKDYRQIEIFVDKKKYPLAFDSCLHTYGHDWVSLKDSENALRVAPLIVVIRGDYLFTRNHNLNILNDILLAKENIIAVNASIISNIKKRSPISRSNQGYQYRDLGSASVWITMHKNKFTKKPNLWVDTKEFFNET